MTPSRQSPRAHRHKAMPGGFTIVELMITLTVLGVLVAAGLPSLTNLVREQRVKAAASDVFSSFLYARSEAVKRNKRVAICASSDGDACASSANWAQGWIVFVDVDGDGAVDTGDDLLKRQGEISGVTVTGTSTNATYLGDGRLAATVTTFQLKSPDNAEITMRCIRLDPSGRPNTQVDSNGDSTDGCQ